MRFNRIFFTLVYLGVIVLATSTAIAWWYRMSFWLFAVFLFWITIFFDGKEEPEKISRKFYLTFFYFTLATIILVRLIPFLHFGEAPLGYDTGIYRRSFERYLVDPQEGVRPLGIVVQILYASGFSINAIMHGFLVMLNLFLGLSLYGLSRTIFRSPMAGLAALFIFAVSISQYEAYIWMFYRMMISITLFVVSSMLVMRGSWAAIVVGGFAGALHPATFLVFGLAYILYTLIMIARMIMFHLKDPRLIYLLGVGAGMLVVAVFANFPEFRYEMHYLVNEKLRIPTGSHYLSSELSGLYLNFRGFRFSTLFYLPFAVLGLGSIVYQLPRIWKSRETPPVLFLLSILAVSFILIVGRMIFYERYLIILDLVIILLASFSLSRFISCCKIYGKGGGVLVSLFLCGFAGVIIFYSTTRTSWISPSELQELKSTSERFESNAYGMATDAYYTPWVYGYMTRRTIAPGYFINYWSLEEWERFWYKGTDDERRELLSRYGNDPIYIFVGAKQKENKPMREFLSQYSTPVSEHVWKYEAR